MASKANLKSSGREAALARRKAMSTQGKQGMRTSAPERTRGAPQTARAKAAPAPAPAPAPAASAPAAPVPAPRPSFSMAPRASVGAALQSPSAASRALARQRRAAMAQDGRRAQRSSDRVRTAEEGLKGGAPKSGDDAGKKGGCGCGCNGERKKAGGSSADRSTDLSQFAHQPGAPARSTGLGNGNGKASALLNKRADAALGAKPTSRMRSLARRKALSSRGKGADVNSQSTASLARQANPKLSGRELAQKVRAQRSSNGGAGERKSAPTGRVHPNKRKAQQGAHQGAADQPWKVAVSETAMGQLVTGTKVGRSRKTTGDEPSTCRPVTGTEYMGADIFREFCQTEPAGGIAKVHVSPTSHGQRVTGNEVGRSPKVTGDEPGTCKNVTGTEYLSPTQYEAFCDVRPAPGPRRIGAAKTYGGKPVSGNMVGRSGKVTGDELGAEIKPTGTQYTAPSDIGTDIAPPKVGLSTTLSGGSVTGTRVGRSGKVTGDEPGSCRVVTGDEYVDLAQYQACNVEARPEPPKVGASATNKGQFVSGTQTGRSGKVTGDEPGTCKAITGTPYAGLEQAADYCPAPQQREIQQRTRPLAMTPGPVMTGIQPGISPAKAGGRSFGGGMTGAAKGACEPLTGTPYVGKDQWAEACGGSGAQPGQADFPRAIDAGSGTQAAAPWQGFSVASPAQEAFAAKQRGGGVTGTVYESDRHITGPFGMATGKITGTEQARFDINQPLRALTRMQPAAPVPAQASAQASAEAASEAEAPAAPERSRITGEGQTAGLKITGDDWDRGERVTGTEGTSARRRNPTRPGPMSAMPPVDRKRNDEGPVPTSRVTGAAGSTDRGALITYSGGARG